MYFGKRSSHAERFVILANVYITMSLTCAAAGAMPFRETF